MMRDEKEIPRFISGRIMGMFEKLLQTVLK
jgi:hypothetical protein